MFIISFFLISIRGPCFCRQMNVADEIILSIPSDVARKLWGVDKGLTNVMIQTEDGSIFNVIPECILAKNNDYSSNDVISTVMIDNKMFHVIIETTDSKVGFTVGIDVIVSQLQLEAGSFLLFTKYFGNFFPLIFFFFVKNGVEMNSPDVDVDEADVAPIDAVNDVDEQPDGGRLPDHVSRMARLDEGLKDITVGLMHLDPPQQFTNGTRCERNNEEGF
ncbi:hypothetical protein Hdeb2414_s0124g00804621 [Helianthus debilis subsp. tardiflorus]